LHRDYQDGVKRPVMTTCPNRVPFTKFHTLSGLNGTEFFCMDCQVNIRVGYEFRIDGKLCDVGGGKSIFFSAFHEAVKGLFNDGEKEITAEELWNLADTDVEKYLSIINNLRGMRGLFNIRAKKNTNDETRASYTVDSIDMNVEMPVINETMNANEPTESTEVQDAGWSIM